MQTPHSPTAKEGLLLSYACGPEAQVWERTIAEVLRSTERRAGPSDALISCHQGLRYTWTTLLEECERVAAGMFALGIRPGDRVGIWSTNCAEWVQLQYACALSGIVLVNVNPAYRSHELQYVLLKSRIRMLFLHERDARADYRKIDPFPGPAGRHPEMNALPHRLRCGLSFHVCRFG